MAKLHRLYPRNCAPAGAGAVGSRAHGRNSHVVMDVFDCQGEQPTAQPLPGAVKRACSVSGGGGLVPGNCRRTPMRVGQGSYASGRSALTLTVGRVRPLLLLRSARSIVFHPGFVHDDDVHSEPVIPFIDAIIEPVAVVVVRILSQLHLCEDHAGRDLR